MFPRSQRIEPRNKVKGSTGTNFIRERMKQKKKSPATWEGLLKEEVAKMFCREDLYGLQWGYIFRGRYCVAAKPRCGLGRFGPGSGCFRKSGTFYSVVTSCPRLVCLSSHSSYKDTNTMGLHHPELILT